MIVVKLEMWPGGDESRKYDLGRAYVSNVGGDQHLGNYHAQVMRKGNYKPEDHYQRSKVARESWVNNYPRLSYNVWRLIIRALKGAFPEEGK